MLYRQANLDHELDARLTTWLAGDFSLDNVTASLRRLERVSAEGGKKVFGRTAQEDRRRKSKKAMPRTEELPPKPGVLDLLPELVSGQGVRHLVLFQDLVQVAFLEVHKVQVIVLEVLGPATLVIEGQVGHRRQLESHARRAEARGMAEKESSSRASREPASSFSGQRPGECT